MCGKILVAVDLSCLSQTVFDYAAALGRDRDSSLIVLNVQEPHVDTPGAGTFYAPPLCEDPELQMLLRKLRPADPSVGCEYRVELGFARDRILDVARQEGADLIVIGSHGRRGITRLLLGSVAEHVMRHAPCPVLVIKDGQQAALAATAASWRLAAQAD